MKETFDILGLNVFIIGKPAAGKTYFANELSKRFPKHSVINTDNYIRKKELLAKELKKLYNQNINYILEGGLAYEILKEIDKKLYPNIIISLEVSDKHVFNVYQRERNIEKYDISLGFHYYKKEKFEVFLAKNNISILFLHIINNFTD